MSGVLKKIVFAVLIVVTVSALSACGKVSEPNPIEGSGYPHSYPRY